MTYRNPFPTVDVIIDVDDQIVLIERKHTPVGWALPGGFVDYGESVEDAAKREALEETSLEVDLEDLLYVYSNPARDARQHNLSVVFIARSITPLHEMVARDDARAVKMFPIDDLPELCFDHAKIIADYLAFKRRGERPKPGGSR